MQIQPRGEQAKEKGRGEKRCQPESPALRSSGAGGFCAPNSPDPGEMELYLSILVTCGANIAERGKRSNQRAGDDRRYPSKTPAPALALESQLHLSTNCHRRCKHSREGNRGIEKGQCPKKG